MVTHTADNLGTEFLHQIFSFIMETAWDNTTLMATLGALSFIETWSVFTSWLPNISYVNIGEVISGRVKNCSLCFPVLTAPPLILVHYSCICKRDNNPLLLCFSGLIGSSVCCSVQGLVLYWPSAMQSQLKLQTVAGIPIINIINAEEKSLFYSRLFHSLTKWPLVMHLASVLHFIKPR